MGRTVPVGIKPELYRLYTKPLTIVELYLVYPYTSISHRYVANNQNITFGGSLYTALSAKRTSIKTEEGTVLNDLEVGLDNVDLEFQTLIASGAFNRKRCVLKLVFDGFLTNSANFITLFDGYLDAPKGDDHWCTLTIKPFPLFDREYPRRLFQVGCNWTFGSDECTFDLNNAAFSGTILAGTTAQVIVFDEIFVPADNSYIPGYVYFTSGALIGQVRPIVSNTGKSITMRISFSDIPTIGSAFVAQRLCGKDQINCQNDFNNNLNFGGYPTVPKEPVL